MKRPSKLEKDIIKFMYDYFVDMVQLKTWDQIVDEIAANQSKSNKGGPKTPKTSKKAGNKFTAGESIDSSAFMDRVSKKKPAATASNLPPNVQQFTMPDGSVIYINTDKTDVEVNDASDYFR